MTSVAALAFWISAISAALMAWSLIWADAQTARQGREAAHREKWSCACACPGLVGFHSHQRCVFPS